MYIIDSKLKKYNNINLKKFMFENKYQEEYASSVCNYINTYTAIKNEILANPLNDETDFVEILRMIRDTYLTDDNLIDNICNRNNNFFSRNILNSDKDNSLFISKEEYISSIDKDINSEEQLRCAFRVIDLSKKLAEIMNYKSIEAINSLAKDKNDIESYYSAYQILENIYKEATNNSYEFQYKDSENRKYKGQKLVIDGFIELESLYGNQFNQEDNIELDDILTDIGEEQIKIDGIEAEDLQNFEGGYLKVLELVRNNFEEIISNQANNENLKDIVEIDIVVNKILNTVVFKYLAAKVAKNSFYELEIFALRTCIRKYAEENTSVKIASSINHNKRDENNDLYMRLIQVTVSDYSKPIFVYTTEFIYDNLLCLYNLAREQVPEIDPFINEELKDVALIEISKAKRKYITNFI